VTALERIGLAMVLGFVVSSVFVLLWPPCW
jgi:hypothetical protein